jgi:hypothetical protein
MGESGYVVVTQRGNENLRFVLETAKSLTVDNAVSVSLK